MRSFGLAEGGVDEFRVQVRATMEREVAEVSRQRVREQLLDALYKANPLDVPKVMVDEQVRELQVQMLRRMGIQKVEQLPPREPYEAPARKRVALGLIIGEIVRANAIRVDRGRVEQRLSAVVASYPDPDSVRDALTAGSGVTGPRPVDTSAGGLRAPRHLREGHIAAGRHGRPGQNGASV